MTNIGFHPERLNGHKTEIVEMLKDLPSEFQQSGGGGWSFLNACNDRNGEQWTGEHRAMEQLYMLGQGVGRVKVLMPRNMWAMLPGGMPYFMVTDEAKDAA